MFIQEFDRFEVFRFDAISMATKDMLNNFLARLASADQIKYFADYLTFF